MRILTAQQIERRNERMAEYNKRPDVIARKKAYDAARPSDRGQQMLRNARARSNKKGYDCTITIEWVRARLAGVCQLSGLEFGIGSRAPSIDRIDNDKGYTPENSRMILTALNVGINQWGFEEYARIARACLDRSQGD